MFFCKFNNSEPNQSYFLCLFSLRVFSVLAKGNTLSLTVQTRNLEAIFHSLSYPHAEKRVRKQQHITKHSLRPLFKVLTFFKHHLNFSNFTVQDGLIWKGATPVIKMRNRLQGNDTQPFGFSYFLQVLSRVKPFQSSVDKITSYWLGSPRSISSFFNMTGT